jgi:hypothetical protein
MLREFLISWAAAGVVYAILLGIAGFVMVKLGWLEMSEESGKSDGHPGNTGGDPHAL